MTRRRWDCRGCFLRGRGWWCEWIGDDVGPLDLSGPVSGRQSWWLGYNHWLPPSDNRCTNNVGVTGQRQTLVAEAPTREEVGSTRQLGTTDNTEYMQQYNKSNNMYACRRDETTCCRCRWTVVANFHVCMAWRVKPPCGLRGILPINGPLHLLLKLRFVVLCTW